jgi:hypothetical protein
MKMFSVQLIEPIEFQVIASSFEEAIQKAWYINFKYRCPDSEIYANKKFHMDWDQEILDGNCDGWDEFQIDGVQVPENVFREFGTNNCVHWDTFFDKGKSVAAMYTSHVSIQGEHIDA